MSTSAAVFEPQPPSFEALGKSSEIGVPPPNTDEAEVRLISLRATRWRLLEAAGTLLPKSWTARCQKYRLKDKNGVPVPVRMMRSKENGGTFHTGMAACASVWACPHCASKISERKRILLKQAIDTWKGRGGKIYMMTLTFPHGAQQKITTLLKKYGSARRDKFFNRKKWRGYKKEIGLCHSVYALETTEGENGWHIHSHHLLFVMPSFGVKEPHSEDLLESWQSACVSAGLGKPNKHGLVIGICDEAAGDYASKWGADLELTKGHIKKGREGHRTPWDLLRDFADNGDVESGEKFKEFALAFKGKRQLFFSRGMLADLDLKPEKTDREIVDAKEDKATQLGEYTDEQVSLLIRFHKVGAVLEIGRYCTWQDVLDFIDQLRPKNYQDRRIRGPDHMHGNRQRHKRSEVSF